MRRNRGSSPGGSLLGRYRRTNRHVGTKFSISICSISNSKIPRKGAVCFTQPLRPC
jgi:hypothetical protein